MSRIPPLPAFSHAARLYVTAAVVMSLAILGVRCSSFFVDYHQGKYQTRDYLFSELADSLAAQGLYPEQVISGDVQCAGYSRIYLSDSPVQCSSFLNRKPKRIITSVTLVVWDATQDEGFCSETSQVFQAWFKEHVPDEMIRHIVTSPRTFDTRTKRLGYCVLMPKEDYSTMKPTVPTP